MKPSLIVNLAISLAVASILAWVYLGVSDLELILNYFYSDKSFDLSAFLIDLGLKKILIACGIFVASAYLFSDKGQKLIASTGISGNILIPTLFLGYVGFIVGYIYLNNISYPLPETDSYKRFELVAAVILMALVGCIYLPYLLSINDELEAPAPIYIVITPFVISFFGLASWVRYVTTGEVDLLWGVRLFCCS